MLKHSSPMLGTNFFQLGGTLKKKKLQVKRMERLGRLSDSNFRPGDLVLVQDTKSGVWSIKSEVEKVKDHQGEVGSKTYVSWVILVAVI